MKGGKLVNDCRPKNESADLDQMQKDADANRDRAAKLKDKNVTRGSAAFAAAKVADDVKKAARTGPQQHKGTRTGAKRIEKPKPTHTKTGAVRKEETTFDEAKKCWKGYEKKGSQKLFGKTYNRCVKKEEVTNEGAAWTKKEGQNKSGGLNEKGRKSYERENPGSDLKAPSKKVGNKRRASFCARMKGMRKRQKPSNNTGDDRLSKSLRAWNC